MRASAQAPFGGAYTNRVKTQVCLMTTPRRSPLALARQRASALRRRVIEHTTQELCSPIGLVALAPTTFENRFIGNLYR